MLLTELWKIKYSKDSISTLSGKKRKHIINIIGIFCTSGICTTTEASRFALAKQYKIYPEEVNGNEVKTVEHRISELIIGNAKKRTGKRKKNLLYSGLLREDILLDLGKFKNSKNNFVHRYFISFRGSLFGLGYDFSDKELEQFIDTCSKNNLFFAYLKKIKDITSILFVKELFIKPTLYLIEKGKFVPDDDIYLSFSMLADLYGFELHKMIKAYNNDYSNEYMKNYKLGIKKNILIKYIDKLMDNTWYSGILDPTWSENIIQLYYRDSDSLYFYSKFHNDKDLLLLFKTMRSIHQSYYETYGEIPPSKHEQELVI